MRGLLLGALLGGALSLGGGGCASGRPTLEYYTLSLDLPPDSPGQPEWSLLINRFWARDPYGQSRIIYRTSAYNLDYYNYRMWASSPPDQVQEWTARYLRAAKLFSRVTTIPEAGGDVELGAVVRRFEEVDNDRDQTWDAALAVDFWLVRRSERTTLWYGSYEATQRAPKRNPTAVAEAMSRCLEQVLKRVSEELAPLVRRGDIGNEKPAPPELRGGPAEMRHGPADIRPLPAPTARPPS
jgi:ABC-type uncharacterized transport system auxiliary subunit